MPNLIETANKARDAAVKAEAKAAEALTKASKEKARAADAVRQVDAANRKVDAFGRVMDVAAAAYKGSRRAQVECCVAIGFAVVATGKGWVDGKPSGLREAVDLARDYIAGGKAKLSGADQKTFSRAKAVAQRLLPKPAAAATSTGNSDIMETLRVAQSIEDALSLLMASLDADYGQEIASVQDLDALLFPAKPKTERSVWAKLTTVVVKRIEKFGVEEGPTGDELRELRGALEAFINIADPQLIERVAATRAAAQAQAEAEKLAAEAEKAEAAAAKAA